MEPFTLSSGAATFAGFIWELCKGALGNELHRRVLESVLAQKLGEGALPANHDLQLASRRALQDAIRALALGIAAQVDSKPSWVEAIASHLKDGTFGDQPLLELRDCPEREWVQALVKLSKSDLTCADLDRLAIPDNTDFSTLLTSAVDGHAQDTLHRGIAKWLDRSLQREDGRPAVLDDFLQNGWPIDKGSTYRITFYQAWCLFFREQIKKNPEVSSILVAQTLAEVRQDISTLRDLKTPTPAEFDRWLGKRFEPIQDWLAEKLQGVVHGLSRVEDRVQDVHSLQRVIDEKLDKQDARQSRALRADLRAKMTRAQELDARDAGKEAIALIEEVYHVARSHGLKVELLEATLNLGLTESMQHDFNAVERRFREAEKLIRDIKQPWQQIQYYRLKAKVLVHKKHPTSAMKVLEKAIGMSKSDDEDVVQVGMFARASYIHLLCDLKRPDDAIEHLVRAKEILQGARDENPITLVAELLEACIHWAVSKADIDQVKEFLELALRHGVGRESAICIGHAVHDCANGAMGMKATEAAILCANAAERLGHTARRPDMAFGAAYTAAAALAEKEDFHAARDRCIRLVDTAKTLGEPKLRFALFQLLSQTSRQLGDKTTAVEMAEAALREAEADATALCLAKMALAEALRDCGRAQEAIEHARAAHQSAEHCDLPPDWAEQVLVLIADCAARLGDWAAAESCASQLGKRPPATPRSAERQKMVDNRIQMYKRLRESLTSVIGASTPSSVARTEGAESVQAANAMLLKSVIEAWKEYPNAASSIYDYWGRGNLLRVMLNMRAFPSAFNMTLEVHTLLEARQAVRLWALIADVLVLIWKGPTVSSHVVCPVPPSFSRAGGGGYFAGFVKGSPLEASAVTGLGAIGSVGKGFPGWTKELNTTTPFIMTKYASVLPAEVGHFLSEEAVHLVSLGRLIVVPATGICCIGSGHGPLESLFAEACNAIPTIKGDAALFPAAWVPYFPDIPLHALADVVQEHYESVRRLRLLLFQKTRQFRSSRITGTESKELEMEFRDSLAEFTEAQAGLNRKHGWGEAREPVVSRYDGFSEKDIGPILVLQNMGYRWRIEHAIGDYPRRPEVLPKSDEPIGTWLHPPDTAPEFLNADHMRGIESGMKRKLR